LVPPKKVTCFIASAIGRPDVDDILDRAVIPVFDALHIRGSRVDRVEHNDDIDETIFHLIDEADFCLVDLTYARPSVYYEAGYAVGSGKPVIFIARSDHFSAKVDDPQGLLRIHFDLQMKNIIPWSAPTGPFRERLRRRVNHVVRPILRKASQSEKQEDERRQFGKLPATVQIQRLTNTALNILRRRGFRQWKPHKNGAPEVYPNHFVVNRVIGQRTEDVRFTCLQSITKNMLMNSFYGSFSSSMRQGECSSAVVIHILVSLRNIPPSRLTGALPSYSPLSVGCVHAHYDRPDGRLSEDIYVHLISGVASQSEFALSLQGVLKQHDM
jgi:hypothetical protein